MGDKTTLVTIVLCVLLIGGFANYRRNAHMSEQFENRTYASLRNTDLDALIQAYQSEIDRIQVWLDNEPIESRGSKRRNDGHLDDRIKRFESFQQEAHRWRALRRQVLEREVALEALQKEKLLRAQGLNTRWRQILKQATTLK